MDGRTPGRNARVSRVTTATFDCQECGACCAPGTVLAWIGSDGWAWLTKAERDRLPKKYRLQVLPSPHNSRMFELGAPDGRCCALTGTVGVRASCAVYAKRPADCRAFTVGSEACLAARKHHGLPTK
jgi:hypothetical protein